VRNRACRCVLASTNGRHGFRNDPGFEHDLDVESDSRTLVWVWYGDLPFARSLDEERTELHGPPELRAAFPSWLQLNLLANVPRGRAAFGA